MRRLAVLSLVCLVVGWMMLPTGSARADGFPTIDGQYSGIGPISAGGTVNMTVVGRGGVPAVGVDAVAVNVTITNPTLPSYLTLWPAGSPRPNASNLNFVVGQTAPNMAIIKVGAGGQVSIFNNAGSVDVIVDVLGWFPTGGAFVGLTPARIVDTRAAMSTIDSAFAGGGPIQQASAFTFSTLSRGGIPPSGVGAVALNVTATNSTASTYLTVWPTGAARPTASNLNVGPGETRPNLVIAKLGDAGQISIFNNAGATDVIVDVLGWLPASAAFTGLTPARLLDSRAGSSTVDGIAAGGGAMTPTGVVNLTVAGRGGVPPTGAGAVAVNVTATNPSGTSYISVWPTGASRPTASNLNFDAAQTTPNLVIATIGAGGQISLFNNAGTVDVIVDVLGWFPIGTSYSGLTPARLMDTRTVAPPVTTPPSTTPTTQPPQPVVFKPGTYFVNTQIAPGRYIARLATPGCYWERLSGFGGTLDEIIANDFVGFNGPVIVDVRPTDAGFKFDGECGNFTPYAPAASPSSSIPPGDFVIGSDIVPGTYVANATNGCYWERLSGFDGTLSQIIDNDFISSPGQVIVTISGGDVGFSTGAKCGTWTKT